MNPSSLSYIQDLRNKMLSLIAFLDDEEGILQLNRRQQTKMRHLVEEKTLLVDQYHALCQRALQDPLLKTIPTEEKQELKTLNDHVMEKLQNNHALLKSILNEQDRMMQVFLKMIKNHQSPSSFYNHMGNKEKASVKVLPVVIHIKG